jgi:hypothetical protein
MEIEHGISPETAERARESLEKQVSEGLDRKSDERVPFLVLEDTPETIYARGEFWKVWTQSS